MKPIFLIALLLVCNLFSAQSIIVRDHTTREAIKDVFITDAAGRLVITDARGKADISLLDRSKPLSFYHPAYNPVIFSEAELALGTVTLSEKTVMLDEIVLSANRHEEKKIDVPYTIHVLKQKEIEFGNQPTSAEVLQNTGAVFVQKSQLGGGSPILRGFEANKVLIVVDGVRMNNAIYRGGHLQDVITLDANMLERAEIVFGPASTIYGSDALGGVMHFYTKRPQLSANDSLLLTLNAFSRYASVNNEMTGHLDFNLGGKRFAALTNITYSDFGDLRSGTVKLPGSPESWDRRHFVRRIEGRDSMIRNNNAHIQVGSAYHQTDVMQRFLYRSSAFFSHQLNLQYSESGNINRYDRLTEMSGNTPRFAEWYYGPQKRFLGAYTLHYSRPTKCSDDMKLIAAWQKIDQDRVSRRFNSPWRLSQMEDVRVLSLNADIFKRVKKHELRYGSEITANDVRSAASLRNIVNSGSAPAQTRYAPGGNFMNTFGVYISHSWDISERFVITDGMRFTYNQLESRFTDTNFYVLRTTARQQNQALTGNLGFTWKQDNNYKISLLLNTGFRTPNIDDMSKVFESANNILIVPNLNIRPEHAFNGELSLSKVFDRRVKADLTGFCTVLEDAIVLADYRLNGQDSVIVSGAKQRVQAMQNRDRAYITGFSAGSQIDFSKKVSFRAIINYTYGRYADLANNVLLPLDHIPPLFGQAAVVFRGKNTDAELFTRFNGAKHSKDYSVSGEDNWQYSADPLNGYMPSWFTLNVRAGYSLTRQLRINFACENISDLRYRVFASGINAPGRNFLISLRYKA